MEVTRWIGGDGAVRRQSSQRQWVFANFVETKNGRDFSGYIYIGCHATGYPEKDRPATRQNPSCSKPSAIPQSTRCPFPSNVASHLDTAYPGPAAAKLGLTDRGFQPEGAGGRIRPNGDYQAQWAAPRLPPSAKKNRIPGRSGQQNRRRTRRIAGRIMDIALAGPGFINFRLKTRRACSPGCKTLRFRGAPPVRAPGQARVMARLGIVDYSSPNTRQAKCTSATCAPPSSGEGHLPPAPRFRRGRRSFATNHIGDWGTQVRQASSGPTSATSMPPPPCPRPARGVRAPV